ncbi:MAG: ABC transporter permease [Fibrobacterota bacterium]
MSSVPQKPRSLLRKVLRHPFGRAGGGILLLLYTIMLFSGFIAPYTPGSEVRDHSYAPPTRLHFFDTEGRFRLRPVFYNYQTTRDRYQRKVYREDTTRQFSLTLFPRGEAYKLFGLIPMNRHLFGASDSAGRVYLFGADARGRDLFSRIIYGSRVSLTIGFIGVLFSTLIAVVIGGIAGYFGGTADSVLMRICEVVMMIPSFYLLLGLHSIFPADMSSIQLYFMIIFILSFIGWAGMARVLRGMTRSIREQEFIQAEESIGQRRSIIILRHIIPQTFSYLVVTLTITIPAYIIFESSLSFIGLGIHDPQTSWGSLLSDAMNIPDIQLHPWILIPGIFIFITVMAFNFLGDALRDVLDPRNQFSQ